MLFTFVFTQNKSYAVDADLKSKATKAPRCLGGILAPKPQRGHVAASITNTVTSTVGIKINRLSLLQHPISHLFHRTLTMSFDQLSSLESQPTTTRQQDDPQYTDDPEFQKLSQDLMAKLFKLTGNISKLSNEVALLGTKRDTERLRERVHGLLEETKDTFKDIGEGVKRLQSWEDVSVGIHYLIKAICDFY